MRLDRILTKQAEILASDNNFKGRYSLAELEAVYDAAGGKCEICGNPPGDINLALDHCHETGKLRGILCRKCNMGLGLLGDSLERIRKAIEYLEKE